MPPVLLTAADLLHVHLPDKQVELVRGVLIVREPPGYHHGEVTARVSYVLSHHARAHDLGRVLAGDPGFHIARDPDTVRGPDVAFVRRERVPHPAPEAFADFAPDLAVEILSPSDRPGQVLAKVADWLSGGAALVWVIDPARRQAHVYRADGSEAVIPGDGDLLGEDVIPGFVYALGSILDL
jgi:Uma2 family endonuclease